MVYSDNPSTKPHVQVLSKPSTSTSPISPSITGVARNEAEHSIGSSKTLDSSSIQKGSNQALNSNTMNSSHSVNDKKKKKTDHTDAKVLAMQMKLLKKQKKYARKEHKFKKKEHKLKMATLELQCHYWKTMNKSPVLPLAAETTDDP